MNHIPMVAIKGNQLTTNTRVIAEYFGKQHKNVTRALRHLMADSPEDFNKLNFELVDYVDSKGESRSMYNVTKDGFMLLAMGFTGGEVTEMKIAFIREFNRMEAALAHPAQRPGQVEELRTRRAQEELLTARPLWAKIQRYFALGLTGKEIALLLKRNVSTIRSHRRRMEACGLLTPAANLEKLQQSGLTLIGGGAK